MSQMQKTVYRDRVTNRLIHRKVAEQRDPSTWTEEQFTFSDEQDSARRFAAPVRSDKYLSSDSSVKAVAR